MIISPSLFPFSWSLPLSPIASENQAKIGRIAKNAFTQAAVSVAVNFTFCATFGTYFIPASIIAFTSAAAAALLFLSIKGIWNRCLPNRKSEPGKVEIVISKLTRVSMITTLTLKLNRYIHEYGHALAAVSTFINAKPTMNVNFRGGQTSYAISYGLTQFGKLLGDERSKLFIAAAGPLISVACGFTEIVASKVLGNDHPLLGELLNDHGFAQIAETILYGMSTLVTSRMDLAHDFMSLWQYGGVHPAIPLTLMLLVLGAGVLITNHQTSGNER